MFLLAPRNGNAAAGGSRSISASQSATTKPWAPGSFEVFESESRHDAPASKIAPADPGGAPAPASGFRRKPDLADWQVLPHDPIERLSENVWRVEGMLPRFGRRRVMTVARMSDGRLVIHGAIALDVASMEAIESWGEPAFLLVPHGRHGADAARFKKRYPELKVLTTRGALDATMGLLAIDGTYEHFPQDDAVELRPLRGVGNKEAVMLVRSRDGVTVVLNDIVSNLPRPNGFAERAALRLLGLGPGPRVSSVVKAEVVEDKEALREDLEALAELPGLVRLIVSHHVMARGAAAPLCLQLAARSL